MKIARLLLFFMLSGLAASLTAVDRVQQNAESISYTDPGIHTVLFFKEGWEFSLPVLQLGSSQHLICKFDHLSREARNYHYTIVQCDAEWNPSRLVTSEYMEGFQENPVNDYAFSINTTIPYVNYRIILPNDQVKILLSGNYLLKVWEDGNKGKPVMIRPFYVTETLAELSGEVQKASFEGYNGPSQQIAFAVNYQKLNVTDPLNEIRTVVMQNGRRDNLLLLTKPTFIRQNQLLYEEKNNLFKGGYEFRNFNAKNLQTNGMGVRAIEYQDPWYHLFLEKDLSARTEIYSSRGDLNGNFLVKNDRASDSDLESDYIYVHFTLQSPDLVTNDLIYVFGALTDWKCLLANQMIYQPDTKLYEATILLKQGFYDYQYAVVNSEKKSIDPTFLEGSHLETENDYHLFVYYRGFSSRYDRLIGYKMINSIKR